MTDSVKAAKAMAKHLSAALATSGTVFPHGNALEVVAKAFGARNWHAFIAEQATNLPSPSSTPEPAPWTKADGLMSREQFVLVEGQCCPRCGLSKALISNSDLEFKGNEVSQTVCCPSCDLQWSEFFTLNRYAAIPDDAEAQAVVKWMTDALGPLDETLLDELVTDMVIDDKLPDINSRDEVEDQDTSIANAECKATDINNDGMTAQLRYLRGCFKSKDDLIQYLAANLGISATSR